MSHSRTKENTSDDHTAGIERGRNEADHLERYLEIKDPKCASNWVGTLLVFNFHERIHIPSLGLNCFHLYSEGSRLCNN